MYKLKVKYPDDKGEDVAKLTIEDQGPKQCVMVKELILESFALSLSPSTSFYQKAFTTENQL